MTKPPPPFRPTHIRDWRVYRGLTIEQLAAKIGRSISYVSELETGVKRYNQEVLEQIAEALEAEPWQLLKENPAEDGASVGDIIDLLDEREKREARRYVEYLRDRHDDQTEFEDR